MSQHTDSETPHEQHQTSGPTCWAVGDFAVHPLALAAPLIDGRAAMLAMCVSFLLARTSIWIADWSIYARLALVRGRDQRAGQDGSDAQYALLDHLRAVGLDGDALALWQSGGLSLADVLGLAVRRGVDVHVLLWDPLDPFYLGHLGNDPTDQAEILSRQGVQCRLDKNCRSVFHLAQGLHQKCAVVDSQVAFVGGIDLTVEYSGDFDRWDTSVHPFASDLRNTDRGASPHPWHDAQVMLTGAAVLDVERNLRQRWDASAGRVQQRIQPPGDLIRGIRGAIEKRGDHPWGRTDKAEHTVCESQTQPQTRTSQAQADGRIQIVRTIPALTYRFAPGGIYGVAQWYQQAVRRAERFIYLESQYLWVEGPPKLNFTRLGWQSRKMRVLVEELAAAAERGVCIAMVLPDHPNIGRAVTDATIEWLRSHAPHATAENRLRFYTLATSSAADDGSMRYRPVYVHAKIGIVDDQWAIVGSANLNSRGMSHDAEMCVAIEQQTLASGLRRILWAEHTGAPLPDDMPWPIGDIAQANQTPGMKIAGRALSLVEALVGKSASDASLSPTRSTPSPEMAALAASLADPERGMRALARLADENLGHLRAGEPLTGHLLPYLRAADGPAYGLNVERHRGLLDPLREVREGVAVPHYGRYI
ncbi:MAG TPA: phospholipase D family protein [Ktedonobacterales bacterium]|nr:phospholipase D family protein [Ktedonobacterales bacterium]